MVIARPPAQGSSCPPSLPPCRIGTAEVESALVAHPKCAEAAVVGHEHAIKGQGIYAYVSLMEGVQPVGSCWAAAAP